MNMHQCKVYMQNSVNQIKSIKEYIKKECHKKYNKI